MDASQPTKPKRQISRLISTTSLPLCVLSQDDVVIFANQALAAWLGCSMECLVGLSCALPFSDPDLAHVASKLALPSDWARKDLTLLAIEDVGDSQSKAPATRCLVPLGADADEAVLCLFVRGESSNRRWLDKTTSYVLRVLTQSNKQSELWYLQGENAQVRTVLEQIPLAIQHDVGVVVSGRAGSGQAWLAQFILNQRTQIGRSSLGASKSSNQERSLVNSIIRMECRLMDRDLMQSMCEVINDSTSSKEKPRTIWLEGIDSLTGECVSILHQFLDAQSDLKCIATSNSSPTTLLQSSGRLWGDLLQRIGPLRIELPSLVARMADIRVLLSAWIATHSPSKRIESSAAFVDALMAYPWPDDVEEFSRSMQFAIDQIGEASILQPDHLPVAIRTAASHFEHQSSVESIDLDAVLEDVEKKLIVRALERFPNNKTSAAKLLGISRARLLRRLQQWGMIDVGDTTPDSDDIPIFKEVE